MGVGPFPLDPKLKEDNLVMATIARLSHAGFNVPRELYQKECDFWEKIIGLKLVRKNACEMSAIVR